MKKLVITSVIALLVAGWSIAGAQEFPEEYLGLPGDNLNLYAVMKLFQESQTLEDFERNLNDENSRINNLDLNGDNLVDYIMVMDYVDDNVHTIVLRAALNKHETQDVAVFTVQQFNDGSVQLQLVGDEALYGRNYIIEPYYTDNGETINPAYVGNRVRPQNVTVVRTTTYEVASWPLISFIFRPTYVVWRSSWHWGYYPTYWDPWRPFYWHTYYGYHSHWHDHYYAHYRTWDHYRFPRYNNYYYSHVRTYSPTVVVNINKGNYRSTYSRPDLKRKGDRLYARTSSVRSSRNSAASRVRSSNSTSVNRSAVKSGNISGRRSSTVTNGRSNTKSATRKNTDAVRRSSGNTSGRSSGNSMLNRRGGAERKSGTITRDRSTRSSSSRTAPSVTRRASSPYSTKSATRSSAERSTRISRKSAGSVPKRSTAAPSVRQGRSSGSSVRKSASSRSGSSVSGRSTSRVKSASKASPSRSYSRPSRSSVKTSRSGSRSSASTPSRRSSRSSSSSRSGRR